VNLLDRAEKKSRSIQNSRLDTTTRKAGRIHMLANEKIETSKEEMIKSLFKKP